jgi:hypothetical protein
MDVAAGPDAEAYFARSGVSPQWRAFVRGLIATLDEHLDAEGRAAMMRAVGARMAEASPISYADTLVGLEGAMNDALAAIGWGYCALSVDMGARTLIIRHAVAPLVPAQSDRDGAWAGAVLEGLYGSWLLAQQGADAALSVRLASWSPGTATLHYRR